MRICVTVASEVEFQIRARFVGCRTRCRTLGRSDSSYAGTRGCRNSLPDFWEAGTRRTPELAAGLLGGRNSSDSGTCCRTLGRPELVGLRNLLPDFRRTPELAAGLLGGRNSSDSSDSGTRLPELAAGLLGGRNSSDAGTRQCRNSDAGLLGGRNSSLNRSLLSSRITSFDQPLSSDFSLIWPVCSPYIGRAKLAGTRLIEGVADDGLHDETVLTKRV